jgi:ribosomal protein S18 acetylase RimI-like enzyme
MTVSAAEARTAPLELSAALSEAGVSLRPVAEADMPFLQYLHRTTRWDELAPTHWPDEAKIGFLDQQFAFQHRHYQTAFADAEFYLISRDEDPIGRIYLDRTRRDLHLIEISLLPEWRGRGLGTALLTMLQQEVRAGRGARVLLNVLATGPARRLYTRLGFVETAGEQEFPDLYVEMAWSPPDSPPGTETVS